MVENLLLEEIRVKIKEIVKDFRLPVENGEIRAPKIFNGYLPPKRHDKKDDFPFILVRAGNGRLKKDGTRFTTVYIIIGCYAEDFDGQEYCLNVMSRICGALMSMDNETLADKYVIQDEPEWTFADEQAYPFWQLDLTTHWGYKAPQSIFKEVWNG